MPARESFRSWTVDVRRSIFKLEWLGVEKVDVEIGDVEALAAKYPDVANDLRAFPRWRRRLACWRARLAIANFSGPVELHASFNFFEKIVSARRRN